MTKYLFLDDAEPKDIQTYADRLEGAAKDQGLDLAISVREPPADLRIEGLLAKLEPSGLLIDVELEKALDDSQRPYPITGTALAQNIRDLQNSQKIREVPLVRLSQRDVIRRYVGKDHTSLDLFDRRFDKDDIREQAPLFAQILVALDAGYQQINEAKPINAEKLTYLLGASEDFLSNLNGALLLRLRDHQDAPTHDFTRFIYGALLDRDGPLISETTLAARLGIDARESGDAWVRLLQEASGATYTGVFSIDLDPRWWADQVADWWSNLDPAHRLLANTASDERCQVIVEQLKIDGLVTIGEDPDSPGPYYWTTCIESGRPLDPMNAYAVIPDRQQEEWHDLRYMCREEAFQHARDPRFDAGEQARILEDRG